jgi:sodium/potassium-transporting ATPase subunit alpha
VVRVGANTVIGRIATLTDSMDASETPLAKEMKYIVYVLMSFAITVGIIFFAICFGLGYNWLTAILFLIGVIVANVPEGLVGVATVCQSHDVVCILISLLIQHCKV